MTKAEALTELRVLHKKYVRSCGSRFRHVPFRAKAVPGWVYQYRPTNDSVERDTRATP